MKVAVLGGNGYLGGRISSEISTHYKTYSITRNNFNHPSCTNIKCDYTNTDKFIELLIGFDVIVNCTGLNKKNSFKHPNKSLIEKTQISNAIAKASLQKKIHVIHISSKHVNQSSKDINDEKKVYALNHIKAEKQLIKGFKNSKISKFQIIRLGNCFGYSPTKSPEFNNLLMNQAILAELNGLKLDIKNPDAIVSFTPLSVVAVYILDILSSPYKINNSIVELSVSYGLNLGDIHRAVKSIIKNDENYKNFLKMHENNFGKELSFSINYLNSTNYFFNEVKETFEKN